MKAFFRKLFAPLLNIFESGDEPYAYKKSHRTILKVVGGLFLFLASVVCGLGYASAQVGALLPGLVFLVVGFTCIVIGTLGSDRAVSKMWGNRS